MIELMAGATHDLEVLTSQVVGLAEVNSGSYNLAGVEQVGDRLAELVSELSPDAMNRTAVGPTPRISDEGDLEWHEVGQALTATKRSDAPFQVLLFGHLDTVFGVESPFQQVERGRGHRLGGPGVADCKGGLVTAVEVLRRVEAAPWRDSVGWQFVVVPDEEIGSHGSKALLTEAGTGCALGLGFEPALPSGGVAGARKGTSTMHLVVRGRSAHVGRAHPEGRSAIRALARRIVTLEAENAPGAGLTINCGRIAGGGALNAVPDLAIGSFNLRLAGPEDWERAEQLFEDATVVGPDDANHAEDGITIELVRTGDRPPKIRDAALSELLDDLAAVADLVGLDVPVEDTGGCCDGNDLAATGVTNVDSLGIRGGGIHSPDEFAFVDSIPERAELSARLIKHRLRAASTEAQ